MARGHLGGTKFERPWLILCEGLGDKELIHRLIERDAALHGTFQVQFPHQHNDNSGGRGKFGYWLRQQPDIAATFRQHVRGVLIISDVDGDRATSLHEIQTGLSQNGLPTPSFEGEVVGNESFPAKITIELIPHEGCGSLDTLCAIALAEKWSLDGTVEAFLNASPAQNWTATKKGKAKLHALMAVTCATKPETSLAHLWQENESFHIPLNHTCFDHLREKLRTVASLRF